jgi:hypothetical protein
MQLIVGDLAALEVGGIALRRCRRRSRGGSAPTCRVRPGADLRAERSLEPFLNGAEFKTRFPDIGQDVTSTTSARVTCSSPRP